jgi:hypothetical protein
MDKECGGVEELPPLSKIFMDVHVTPPLMVCLAILDAPVNITFVLLIAEIA